MMAKLAIYIDGGYIAEIAKPNRVWVDFGKLSAHITEQVRERSEEPLDLIRTYYYDCLPFQSEPPTEDERKRFGAKRDFFSALRGLPNYAVREGRLVYRGRDDEGRPIFQQKRVDLMIGLDIALLSVKGQVTHIALVSGDADLVPAVEAAQQEAVIVWLVHGPTSTSNELKLTADNRILLDSKLFDAVKRRR